MGDAAVRVLAGDLSGARALVSGSGKGVIAPPALADSIGDGRLDIIVATFDGRLIALSGSTRESSGSEASRHRVLHHAGAGLLRRG